MINALEIITICNPDVNFSFSEAKVYCIIITTIIILFIATKPRKLRFLPAILHLYCSTYYPTGNLLLFEPLLLVLKDMYLTQRLSALEVDSTNSMKESSYLSQPEEGHQGWAQGEEPITDECFSFLPPGVIGLRKLGNMLKSW